MAEAGHYAVLVGPKMGLVDPGEGINPVGALGVVDPSLLAEHQEILQRIPELEEMPPMP